MVALNQVQLIGNLGADPEIRMLANGSSVASFSLATTEHWKNKETGQKEESTEWHRINVWGEGLVQVIAQYLKKGHRVFVQGKLQTRKWQDKDGHDRWSTDIVVSGYKSQLILLEKKDGANKQLDRVSQDEAALQRQQHELDDEISF